MKSDRDNTPRTQWLVQYEPWLKLLARLEIDNRFQGKFSPSDAVQQTMMEAWRDWEQFDGCENAQRLAWLRKILANQLAYLARRYAGTKKRDISREVSLDHSLAQSSQRLDQLFSVEMSSPSERMMAHEHQVMVASVLESLPEDYRQVILMRNLEDLPHGEIAKRMGRTEGAVRMLWIRALEMLRESIQRAEGEP